MIRPSFWHDYAWSNAWPANHVGLAATVLTLLILAIIIEIVLKALALWRAARLNQPIWFVILLIVNSAGLLPLIYLLVTKPEKR